MGLVCTRELFIYLDRSISNLPEKSILLHSSLLIDVEIRSWLLAFTACQIQTPLPQVDVDWGQVLQQLIAHRLIGNAHYCLRLWDNALYPPANFQHTVRLLHYRNCATMQKVYGYFRSAADVLQQAGIDFLVLKGPALAHLIMPHVSMRYFVDLDLMVRERDWLRINDALSKAGYQVEEGFTDPPPKLTALDLPHHDTKYIHRETGFIIEMHYEDLVRDGFAARGIDAIWSRAVSLSIDGQSFRTLCPADHLLHLCAHAHWHAFVRFSWLTDLVFILREHADRIDWDIFLQTVFREEAQVPVYYTLDLIARLFDIHPPDGILQAVRPDAFRRWWHNRYMPQKAIDSLAIVHWEAYSIKSRPLFSSALLNLLVMGRRAEKLRYLLRMVFPPAEWLRHAYGLPPKRLLAPYYLLRPLRLVWHTLQDLFAHLFRRPSP